MLIPNNKNQPGISYCFGNNFLIQRLMLFLKCNVILCLYYSTNSFTVLNIWESAWEREIWFWKQEVNWQDIVTEELCSISFLHINSDSNLTFLRPHSHCTEFHCISKSYHINKNYNCALNSTFRFTKGKKRMRWF